MGRTMTNKRLQEIQDYLGKKRTCWYKDMPTEIYIEHVDELIEEVYCLRKRLAELEKPSPAVSLLRSVYGEDADIRVWSKEEVEAYRERMDKAMENRPRPGLLPSPRYPRRPRKRE